LHNIESCWCKILRPTHYRFTSRNSRRLG